MNSTEIFPSRNPAGAAWLQHMQYDAGATLTPTPPAPSVVVRYCRFHDEAGYAVRDGQRRCFYVDHAAQFFLLSDADSAHLVLLGSVDLVEEQNVLEALAGGAVNVCISRRQEVA